MNLNNCNSDVCFLKNLVAIHTQPVCCGVLMATLWLCVLLFNADVKYWFWGRGATEQGVCFYCSGIHPQ